ncbi:hypothetical protein H4Q26_011700 [Puccinia striiformis f. sp. tritici PST-130]|nr:hypothetical protein H4Q26_011700 [Puccinia striiformis f. sp. tritici PST-130]
MSFNRPPSYASEHSHEDMLDAYSLRDGPFSVNDIPGIATASSQTPSYSDNPWMRMKMQAIREFLNSHPDAISQLPAYMPHDTTDPVEALRRQGREQMPPPPTPAGLSRPEPPMFAPESPDAPAPANRVVNLVSRDGPTYETASAMDDAPRLISELEPSLKDHALPSTLQIAHGVLLDILDSYGVDGDITVQAESACADLLTRVQKRFKAPFEAEGF